MNIVVETAEALAMVRDSAAGIATRRDLARIRALRYQDPGFDRAVWHAMSEMGWIGLRVPEARGGVGLGMAECCVLMEELGAALLPEPLIGAMMAAAILDDRVLADQLSGDRLILAAWQEMRGAVSIDAATRFGNGTVAGVKRYIHMAAGADAFVVATNQGWALVERDAAGVILGVTQTQDGGHYGTLILDEAHACLLPCAVEASSLLGEATLATAAYLLGLIDEALDRTLDFLRTRVQFGKPLGSFQALQHRAVDLTLEAALTRASIGDAARRWDAAPASSDALAAVSRAKARASATAMLVTRQAIQLHGGIGYTDEHDIGLYLRKAMVIAPAYGDAGAHRARFAKLLPDHAELS